MTTTNNKFWQSLKIKPGLEAVLQAIAFLIMFLVFLKAIIDIDTNYDTWWYHLPFAARMWGIVPIEEFTPQLVIQHRFEGFPLLIQWLEGLFWFITGRVQSANLVGFCSLIIYLVFLKTYFQVPLYLSAIALLAIPAVFTHAATCFVDLPGNLGMSVLMMMTYLLFRDQQFPNPKAWFVMFLGAAVAANTKPQLQPLTFLVGVAIAIRLLWLYWNQPSNSLPKLGKIVPIALVASLLIFATPVKNIALHGNPFYPIKIEVAGIVLNHEENPKTYQEGNRPQKWLDSVLEITTPPWWSTDQWNAGIEKYMDRGGGFFGTYVVCNLLLLVGLFIHELKQNRQLASAKKLIDARTALITVLLMSIVPANFPQSHELRYFMFWMICLVSLNLYLLSRSQIAWRRWRWLQPKYVGVIYLIFQLFVQHKAGRFYGKPVGISLEQQLKDTVRPELLSQITPNSQICLKSKHGISNEQRVPFVPMQNTFLYSAYFHPELDYSYSVKASLNTAECGDRTIIPSS
ncbi:hypothetical protein [Pleurocapsa sp. PCC 7319]|uniref:hypothetical protein n=1 Tax=Pleurocapsa sp. PCC 7319 TaxID=118161 RepID=UPI00034A21F2|nr:hypothetical protein [Pleurocapsa sp. PCC 7319]